MWLRHGRQTISDRLYELAALERRILRRFQDIILSHIQIGRATTPANGSRIGRTTSAWAPEGPSWLHVEPGRNPEIYVMTRR